MKIAILLGILLLMCAPGRAQGKRLLLFAVLTRDSPVELADGAKWMMDKGDAFPVVMFKEQQTKVVLQLAGTSFLIDAANVRVLEEKEVTEEVLMAYRRNVASYLEGKSKKWRASAGGSSSE